MARRCMMFLVMAAMLALTGLTPTPLRAATATMSISVDGRPAGLFSPGMRISVTVSVLPVAHHAYCLGLASAIDRYSLPVSLGQLVRNLSGSGRIRATIPTRLFPAEPAGPFLLFVGTCTPIAPDRPFLTRAIIRIVPPGDVRR